MTDPSALPDPDAARVAALRPDDDALVARMRRLCVCNSLDNMGSCENCRTAARIEQLRAEVAAADEENERLIESCNENGELARRTLIAESALAASRAECGRLREALKKILYGGNGSQTECEKYSKLDMTYDPGTLAETRAALASAEGTPNV